MAETAIAEPVDAEVVDEEVSPGTDLVPSAAGHDVSLWRTTDPVEQIAEATRLAAAYKDVVKRQGLIASIRGREHPQVEAWQLLGSMLNVHPVPTGDPVPLPWPQPVPAALKDQYERGLTFGFTASYIVVKNGQTVGGGQSRCTRSESTWKERDDFALASMAQTRATSKALSGPLRFVMVLAGYQATPAEEMPPAVAGQGPPHGPECTTDLAKEAGPAATKIASGEPEGGRALWLAVKERCGGYVPEAAALALIEAAKMVLATPLDATYEDDRGDIPTVREQESLPDVEASPTDVTEAAVAGLADEVLTAWVEAGVSEKEANDLVQGCLRKRQLAGRWNSLQDQMTKAREAKARKEAIR